MSRESAHVKARRYIVEGRLIIRALDARTVRAHCRGDAAIYTLGHDGKSWHCDCPARGRCSHLLALGLVVVLDHPSRSTT